MDFMMMNQMQIQQHQQQELFRQQQQMFQQQQQDAMNMQMNDEIMQQQLNLNDFLNYYNYMTRISPNPFRTSLECVTEGKKINKALVKTGQFLLSSKGIGNSAYVSFKSKAIYTLAVRDGNKYIRDANAAIKKGNKTEALKNLKAAKACFEKAIKSVRDGANSHTLYEKVYGDMITGGLMSYLSDTFRTFRAAKELKEYGEFGESWGKELKKQGVLKIINVFTLGFSGYHVFKKRRKVNRDADKAAGKIDKTKLNQFKNDTLYLLRVYLQVVNEMIANLEGKTIPTKENYTMDMYDADIIYENLMDIIDEPVTEGANTDSFRAFKTAVDKGQSNIREANKLVQNGKYDEAVRKLQEAKKNFLDGIEEIHNIPDGPLSATVVQFFAKGIVSTYQMLKAGDTLKTYSLGVDDPFKDWASTLKDVAVTRIIDYLMYPTILFTTLGLSNNAGLDVGRRMRNTQAEKARGSHKKFTFNGFKEDLLYIMNAYIDAIDGMIKNVRNQKVWKSRDKIVHESYYSDMIDELLESAF